LVKNDKTLEFEIDKHQMGYMGIIYLRFCQCLPFTPANTNVFLTLSLPNITKAYKYALSGTLGTAFGALAGYSIPWPFWQ